MAQTFFVLDPTKPQRYSATTTSGNQTLVEPVTLEPVEVFSPENGGDIVNTAVSGQSTFAHGTYPEDYPKDAEERFKNSGGTK